MSVFMRVPLVTKQCNLVLTKEQLVFCW